MYILWYIMCVYIYIYTHLKCIYIYTHCFCIFCYRYAVCATYCSKSSYFLLHQTCSPIVQNGVFSHVWRVNPLSNTPWPPHPDLCTKLVNFSLELLCPGDPPVDHIKDIGKSMTLAFLKNMVKHFFWRYPSISISQILGIPKFWRWTATCCEGHEKCSTPAFPAPTVVVPQIQRLWHTLLPPNRLKNDEIWSQIRGNVSSIQLFTKREG